VATELTRPKSSWLLSLEYSAEESVRNSIREHRWTEMQTSSGMGKTGSRKLLHQRSGSGVAVLEPVSETADGGHFEQAFWTC